MIYGACVCVCACAEGAARRLDLCATPLGCHNKNTKFGGGFRYPQLKNARRHCGPLAHNRLCRGAHFYPFVDAGAFRDFLRRIALSGALKRPPPPPPPHTPTHTERERGGLHERGPRPPRGRDAHVCHGDLAQQAVFRGDFQRHGKRDGAWRPRFPPPPPNSAALILPLPSRTRRTFGSLIFPATHHEAPSPRTWSTCPATRCPLGPPLKSSTPWRLAPFSLVAPLPRALLRAP